MPPHRYGTPSHPARGGQVGHGGCALALLSGINMAMIATGGFTVAFAAERERLAAAAARRRGAEVKQGRRLLKIVELEGPPPQSLEEPGARECVVCMARPVTTAFAPCRHSVICDPCLREVRLRTGLCPLCRSRISAAFRGRFEDEFADLEVVEAEHREAVAQSSRKEHEECAGWPQSWRWAASLCSM